MTAGQILGWLPIAFGFVVIAAAVVAYYRSSLAKATIDTLKESNGALTERVGLLEVDSERKTEQIRTLKAENETLRNVVTGIDFLKRISTDLNAYNEARKAEHDQILTSVASVHDLTLELLKRTA
jgi:hypothetical protein